MNTSKKWDSSRTFEQINILSHYAKDEWKIYINDFNPDLEEVFKDVMNQLGLPPTKYYVHIDSYAKKLGKHRYCILEAIYIGDVPKLDIPLIRSKLELLTTYESIPE